jgi:protein-tyrosine phosphatase
VRKADDVRDVVHRAVQALAEGRLVVIPTETVYGVGALALNEEAVARLRAVKSRKGDHPLPLAIRGAEEALDYAPDVSPLFHRLARRCWPGPVTLVVDASHPQSLIRQLPPTVQQAVFPHQTVGLRVPGHQVALDVLQMIAGPLVLTSANRAGEPEAKTAEEAVRAMGDDVALILDDGPSRFGDPSTVVRVRESVFEILREGVVPGRAIKRLANVMVLFVCTGNTCRSPMAEWFFRKMACEQIGCKFDALEDNGLVVRSAGIAAGVGGKASPEALEVLEKEDLDMSSHETQPVTETLVRNADVIYTMTPAHRQAIVAQWPEAAERTKVLAADGSSVVDPIGGTSDRYKQCAEQIRSQLAARLDELEL